MSNHTSNLRAVAANGSHPVENRRLSPTARKVGWQSFSWLPVVGEILTCIWMRLFMKEEVQWKRAAVRTMMSCVLFALPWLDLKNKITIRVAQGASQDQPPVLADANSVSEDGSRASSSMLFGGAAPAFRSVSAPARVSLADSAENKEVIDRLKADSRELIRCARDYITHPQMLTLVQEMEQFVAAAEAAPTPAEGTKFYTFQRCGYQMPTLKEEWLEDRGFLLALIMKLPHADTSSAALARFNQCIKNYPQLGSDFIFVLTVCLKIAEHNAFNWSNPLIEEKDVGTASCMTSSFALALFIKLQESAVKSADSYIGITFPSLLFPLLKDKASVLAKLYLGYLKDDDNLWHALHTVDVDHEQLLFAADDIRLAYAQMKKEDEEPSAEVGKIQETTSEPFTPPVVEVESLKAKSRELIEAVKSLVIDRSQILNSDRWPAETKEKRNFAFAALRYVSSDQNRQSAKPIAMPETLLTYTRASYVILARLILADIAEADLQECADQAYSAENASVREAIVADIQVAKAEIDQE